LFVEPGIIYEVHGVRAYVVMSRTLSIFVKLATSSDFVEIHPHFNVHVIAAYLFDFIFISFKYIIRVCIGQQKHHVHVYCNSAASGIVNYRVSVFERPPPS